MKITAPRFNSLLIVAILGCGGAVFAQSPQNPLQLRMSLSYQGTPAGPVFQALAEVLGYRLRLDSKVTGAVTLDVRNVTAETVLRAICESVGCRWRVESGTLVVDADAAAAAGAPGQTDPYAHVKVRDVYEEIPVQIRWSDAPVDAALKTLARMLDAELVSDRALADRRITVILNKNNPRTALNAICEQASCQWRLMSDPKRVLRVAALPPSGSPRQHEAPWPAEFARGVARPLDAGVTPPKLLSSAKPRYTPDAMRAKIEGTVVVDCIVETDGTVRDVRVVKSLDTELGLDRAAVDAARLYLFEPGIRAGKRIPVVVTVSMNFSLR